MVVTTVPRTSTIASSNRVVAHTESPPSGTTQKIIAYILSGLFLLFIVVMVYISLTSRNSSSISSFPIWDLFPK